MNNNSSNTPGQNIRLHELSAFFQELNQYSCQQPFVTKLELFLARLQKLLDLNPIIQKGPELNPEETIDICKLGHFLNNLANPMKIAKQAGLLCNPWTVALLKRDEVRNSSVLAWWLSPNESHGFGDKFIAGLLHEVKAKLKLTFEEKNISTCQITTESNPDGDLASRVDIDIDCIDFYMIIEVKIDAPESPGQILRYCELAQARARHRPWAVLFLTPQGRMPTGNYSNDEQGLLKNVLPISWRKTASLLDDTARKKRISLGGRQSSEMGITTLLAFRFCDHIRKF